MTADELKNKLINTENEIADVELSDERTLTIAFIDDSYIQIEACVNPIMNKKPFLRFYGNFDSLLSKENS